MSDGPFRRGDVVWHPAPFKPPPKERPFLVLSDHESHPFHGTEYAVVGLTRTSRPRAIRVDDQSWDLGNPGSDSFASSWYVFTLKHADITRPKGALTREATGEVATAVALTFGVDTFG